MLESKIQNKIIKFLESEMWYTVKFIKTNRNGIPDIMAVRNEEVFFIEVKTEKGKISKLQKYCHKQLENHNINIIVPYGYEDFKTKYRNLF